MALKRISGRVGSSNMYSYWLGCVWAVKTIWEGEVMDKQEIAEIINNFPLPQEGQKWEWAKEISEALHDRIYGKGECEQCGACEELIIPEHVKEFANKYGIGLDVIYEYALRWAELKVMKKFNKRNYDAIAQEIKETITDKPKEYCTCEGGKFFHLQITLPLQDEWICKTCNKPIKNKPLAKPIKTEKKKLFCSICGYYTEYEKECGTNEKGEFICYKNGHLLKHQAERILGIKTEKIEPLEQCYNDGKHFIVTSTSAVINKLNEVIDRFNERGI
jgi:hypothetical protein